MAKKFGAHWHNYRRSLDMWSQSLKPSLILDGIKSVRELIIPARCGGCGKAGFELCPECMILLRKAPHQLFPTVDTRCPLYALGPYSGPWRNLILDIKIRRRYDLFPYAGALLKAGVEYLTSGNFLEENWAVVSAPTSDRSRKKRGCDIVTEIGKFAGLEPIMVVKHTGQVADSEGLGPAERRKNLRGGIQVISDPPKRVLLIDDVITTGATIAATADVLRAHGSHVIGAVGICGA
ncbi:MAG: ComF family protein [Corynebacterium sp.]|nr:ComF family protein [Corynebacterium sp.]